MARKSARGLNGLDWPGELVVDILDDLLGIQSRHHDSWPHSDVCTPVAWPRLTTIYNPDFFRQSPFTLYP